LKTDKGLDLVVDWLKKNALLLGLG
jgi:hypothetical protein